MVTGKLFLAVCALLNGLAVAEISTGNFNGDLTPDIKDKRAADCEGVECPPAPTGLECRNDPDAAAKIGMAACCPDLVCTHPDGTVSKHAGFAASGSKGNSYNFADPATGTAGSGFTKAFSSSKSYSSGGNVDDISKLHNPPNWGNVGPPPGFGAGFSGPPPGFAAGFAGPPPGFGAGFAGPPPGFGAGFAGPPPGFGAGYPPGFGPPAGFGAGFQH